MEIGQGEGMRIVGSQLQPEGMAARAGVWPVVARRGGEGGGMGRGGGSWRVSACWYDSWWMRLRCVVRSIAIQCSGVTMLMSLTLKHIHSWFANIRVFH